MAKGHCMVRYRGAWKGSDNGTGAVRNGRHWLGGLRGGMDNGRGWVLSGVLRSGLVLHGNKEEGCG